MNESDQEDEIIAIDDGGDQVDIKIPSKTFLTQNNAGGRDLYNEDLDFEEATKLYLP